MDSSNKNIWDILSRVSDPEVPVLSVTDLGVIRDVKFNGTAVEVIITPTYSGCPAMDTIAMNIRIALMAAGYTEIKISTVLSPAWTTDWMTTEGKEKLKAYGIAPPRLLKEYAGASDEVVECPRCNSMNTIMQSEFGSTACKSLYQCMDCREPFDHFKCH